MIHVEYSKIISRIRKFAIDHYENGWDIFVEAYTDYELLELFKANSVQNYKGAKRVCLEIIELQSIKQSEQAEY